MIPTALRIVAVIQLLAGLSSLAHVLVHLGHGGLMLDFGVFGIPAYFGLMRLDPTWRTWTLAMTGIGLAVTAVLPIIGLATGGPVTVQIFGVQLGTLSHDWVWIMMVPLFVLCLWQLRVLLRPDVRALFATASAS